MAVKGKSSDIHPTLQPLQFHGMDIDAQPGKKQAVGECPFCGKENKFFISLDTTKWDCKSCGLNGNGTTFLRYFHSACMDATTVQDYQELANERGILFTDTLVQWGVCKNILTNEWLVPGQNTNTKKVDQLYRYVYQRDSGKYRLYATTGVDHKLHGLHLWSDKNKDKKVLLCEGPWDAMVLWELLGHLRRDRTGSKLVVTSNQSVSMLNEYNVIAVPGCNVFNESWLELFKDQEVTILYDNDHAKPHKITGQLTDGAGYLGTRRVVKMLTSAEEPPSGIKWLKWGSSKGKDKKEPYFDPNLPSGYDLRDYFRQNDTPPEDNSNTPSISSILPRKKLLENLLFSTLITPVTTRWVNGGVGGDSELTASSNGYTKGKGDNGIVPMECIKCERYDELINSWRKALKWTEGLDRALSFMLAVITSTEAVGDQLWGKVISPPSSGKTVLCEALSVCREYTIAKSTIKGFHSGYKVDKEGSHNTSFILKVKNKTLITKDGDTLLKSPNIQQILSEARDVFDRNSRSDYKNGMGVDHEGINMTWLLCGTSAMYELDSSDLGERFLTCTIMEGIDDDLEDEILARVANRAFRNMSLRVNGKAESQTDPARAKAMGLTGGYVKYLRENANELLSQVEFSDENLRRCMNLGKLVAYMRARPSKKQDEIVEREFSPRLVEQHVRLATCLTVVLNKKSVDDEVMVRVQRVAMDTARGKTLEIVKHLFHVGINGYESAQVAALTNESPQREILLLRFLRKIGVTEPFYPKTMGGLKGKIRWRLTPRLMKLCGDVFPPPEVEVDEFDENE